MNSQKLFLLDAYALIFRAYYALIKMPRVTASGFNTSAIFGFVNTLEELLRKENPSHLAICFDPAGPTFRNEAFAEYKGEREATPEDIKLSVPIIKEIVKAYNIPILEVAGFEADDVIGTMAKRASKEGFTTYMMTPDKDFGQLVGPQILQYKPSYRGQDIEIRGEEEVCQRYGIQRTSQVIDLLALMGDKVDNIPGCPGVGEKTAVKLIAEFDSVENLIDHTDSLKGALRKKVEENKEQIIFSKFLATIRTDVPVDEMPEDLKVKSPDTKKLFAIFDELEFRALRKRVETRLKTTQSGAETSRTEASAFGSLFSDEELDGTQPTQKRVILKRNSESYFVADNEEEIAKLDNALSEAERCGLWTISEGENDMEAIWLATAISIEQKGTWFVDMNYAPAAATVLDTMARADIEKITAGAKRDYVLAARKRTDNARALLNYSDVTLSHYLLEPEMKHDISILVSTYLNSELPEMPIMPKTGNRLSPTPIADAMSGLREEFIAAVCARAESCIPLLDLLNEEIKQQDMDSLLNDIELPLSTVLADMELTGVRIDVEALNKAADDMRLRLQKLEEEIYALADEEFNIGSPAKVGEILFDKLELEPKPKKTKTGQYSTSEDNLEKVAAKHPIVNKILLYRQLKKLLNTYLVALPASINQATGKIHTNYNQTVTATGRISSSSPNLQNIPVRDSEGRDIRRAFIANKGDLFLSADYSQIELRLVADFSGDQTMLEAFANDQDIHAATAAKIYHKPVEDVTAEERRHAKTANFGILYGISAFGLAARLGIPRGEAKDLIDTYFERFPGIKKYMSDSVEHARQKGYVVTLKGRRRRLPDINSRNATVRGYAERNAINAPIQGYAADVIKEAMVKIWQEMESRGLKSKMIMQVHDELNFDVVAEELPLMQELVAKGMESVYNGRVRLTASCGVADNWLDAH